MVYRRVPAAFICVRHRWRSEYAATLWRVHRVKLGTEEGRPFVDALAEKLDARLRKWKKETAAEARERILEVIELADQDVLDLARSRVSVQEVLDLLDGPPTR